MNWYSLRVMSGKENKVKDSIFRELDFDKDLKANVEQILIPTENIVHIKDGKKTVKEKMNKADPVLAAIIRGLSLRIGDANALAEKHWLELSVYKSLGK